MRTILVAFVLLFFLDSLLWADDVTFPMLAQIVDVTQKPYQAKGDGKTDDTRAIQKALDDHPDGNHIIYLPKGTYLISQTLTWPKGSHPDNPYRRTILQGQHKEKTTIKLRRNATGYNNPTMPKPVIYTGEGSAPGYRNAIRDLSLVIDKGNPAAIGIQFNSGFQGTLENVRVKALDYRGVAGIDMAYASQIGPLLIKNVEVHGFNKGIVTGPGYNGMTVEHVMLYHQKEVAFLNQGQMVAIRGLTVKGKVPGIINRGESAALTVVDSRFGHIRRGTRGPAIRNEQGAMLFARNLKVSGFERAIYDQGPGRGTHLLDVREYMSHGAEKLCSSPNRSLQLPIAETPNVPWGNTDGWVAISGDYGGTRGDGTDDSRAIQEAIDDGAETIYFNAGGRYTINRDVYIRKNVRRIIGLESRIDGTGRFIIDKGVPPEVVFERFEALGGGIFQQSGRLLILRNLTLKSYESKVMGSGDLFLHDVSLTGPMRFHLQSVWARQLHTSYAKGTQITNDGGRLWILGLTSTNGQNLIHTKALGETEILGAHVIAGPQAKQLPMFIADTSALSIAGLRESAPRGNAYHTIVLEARPDMQVNLLSSKLRKNTANGVMLPLFVGYTPRVGTNLSPRIQVGKNQLLVLPGNAPLTSTVIDDGRGKGYCKVPVVWNKVAGVGLAAFSHQKAPSTWVSFSYAGDYLVQIEANDGERVTRDTIEVSAWDKRLSTADHNGDGIPSGRGADATIHQMEPDKNFGMEPVLRVCNYPEIGAKLYARFDLSALPGPLDDAAIQIKIRRPDTLESEWNVYGLKEMKDYGEGKLNENWNEFQITWNNAPGNQLDATGGIYREKEKSGGGVRGDQTVFLGVLKKHPDFGYFFKSKQLVRFLKADSNGLVTLIFTSLAQYKDCDECAAKELRKVPPPSLLVNYIDPNRSVGGDIVPGGYKMSSVEVDPFSLQVSFTLLVASPQVVAVEVFDEQGRRVMLLHEGHLDGDKLIPFQFSARDLRTGNYLIKITGEAFKGEGSFVILN